jgi:hypothetical protein
VRLAAFDTNDMRRKSPEIEGIVKFGAKNVIDALQNENHFAIGTLTRKSTGLPR